MLNYSIVYTLQIPISVMYSEIMLQSKVQP